MRVCFYPDGAGRPAAHLARLVEQCFAALFVPPAFSRRIRARQDDCRCVPAVVGNMDSGLANLLFSSVSRRLHVVVGESVDDLGDLLWMHGLDNLVVFTFARRVVARQVARGGERRVVRTVLRADCVR